MAMTILSVNMKFRIFISILAGCLVGIIGCKSGFDPAALNLDPQDVILYGNQVKAGKVPAADVAFGQLMPGDSAERGKVTLGHELSSLYSDFAKFRALPKAYSFDAAQTDALANWADGLEKKIAAEVAPTLSLVAKNAEAASNLARVLVNYLKTDGSLESAIKDGEQNIPPDAKSDFASIAKSFTDNLGRIFQISLVAAQTLMQKDASGELTEIKKDLGTLLSNLENLPLITGLNQRDRAKSVVRFAIDREKSVRTFVELMSSKEKIGADLETAVAELTAALVRVNNGYVALVEPTFNAEAKDLYEKATNAAKALKKIVDDYPTMESLKNPAAGDIKIAGLVDRAFTGDIPVILSHANIERPTDVNELARLLSGSTDVVIMREDASSLPLIRALSASVVYEVARQVGLASVDNVVGPNHDRLNKTKADFGMSNEDFLAYVKSRAHKISAETSKEGKYKNIFVVFADHFAAGADVVGMIDEFAKNGKVIVITAEPSKFKGSLFVPRGLNLAEGIMVANATLGKEAIKVSPISISDPVVRVLGGLGHMTLASLPTVVEDTAARIARFQNPTKTDILNSALNALAVHNVPTNLVATSNVLHDPLPIMQDYLDRDRSHYIREGSGRGEGAVLADIRREENIKKHEAKTSERLRQDTATKELNRLLSSADDTVRDLKDAGNGLNASADFKNAKATFAHHWKAINKQLKAIDNIITDDSCDEKSHKVLTTWNGVGNPTKTDPRAYFVDITAKEIGQTVDGNVGSRPIRDALDQLGVYVPKMLSAARGELYKAFNNKTELPYIVLGCFAYTNGKARVQNRITDLKRELGEIRRAIDNGETTSMTAGSPDDVARIMGQLGRLSTIDDQLKQMVENFDDFDVMNDDNFFAAAPPATRIGALARAGGPNSEYRKLNRRMYAYLFSQIVGKIQNASIPFYGDAQLYSGFNVNDVMVKKLKDELNPLDLPDRLIRTLLIKETINVVEIYKRIISKIHELPIDDREAFEKEAANDFLAFFDKVKDVATNASLIDFAKVQSDLRNEISAKLLPDEIMTMLDRYPAWHPYAYFTAALGTSFDDQWAQEAGGAAVAKPTLLGYIDAHYAPLIVNDYSAPDDLLKNRAVAEYKSLRDLAVARGAAGPALGVVVAPAKLQLQAPGYPPAAAPAALKGVRFQSGTIGNVYLAAQAAGVKKLIPVWSDLLKLSDSLKKSADKIYFYLTLVKKN